MQTETTDELLNDPGDLTLADEIAAQMGEHGEAHVVTGDATLSVFEEPPVHRAVCMVAGCDSSVTYRPTSGGGGMFVLERIGMDGEASIGIGPNGRPVCPVDGHGEMAGADETIPAADAFAEVQRMQQAQQASLPGVFPAFNFEGAFKEIVLQARRVESLKSTYDDAKQEASDAKKSLDKAAELLMTMTLEYERRRREKGAEPAEATETAAEPVGRTPCTWELAHEGQACPVCTRDRETIEALLGGEIVAPDAQTHADQVDGFVTKMDVEETQEALGAVIHRVPLAIVVDWTPEDRAAVRAYTEAIYDQAHGSAEVTIPERPAVLLRSHIAEAVIEGAAVQRCTGCGETIQMLDPGLDPFAEGEMIGIDCPGPNVEHHYPERTKRKPKAEKKARAKKGGR